jgi:hypothetical protein
MISMAHTPSQDDDSFSKADVHRSLKSSLRRVPRQE